MEFNQISCWPPGPLIKGLKWMKNGHLLEKCWKKKHFVGEAAGLPFRPFVNFPSKMAAWEARQKMEESIRRDLQVSSGWLVHLLVGRW